MVIYSVERTREAVYTHQTDLIVRIVIFPLSPLFCVVFDILLINLLADYLPLDHVRCPIIDNGKPYSHDLN
jgi:hypothetical protein